jgi:hypothetical protein
MMREKGTEGACGRTEKAGRIPEFPTRDDDAFGKRSRRGIESGDRGQTAAAPEPYCRRIGVPVLALKTLTGHINTNRGIETIERC